MSIHSATRTDNTAIRKGRKQESTEALSCAREASQCLPEGTIKLRVKTKYILCISKTACLKTASKFRNTRAIIQSAKYMNKKCITRLTAQTIHFLSITQPENNLSVSINSCRCFLTGSLYIQSSSFVLWGGPDRASRCSCFRHSPKSHHTTADKVR